MSEIKRSGAWNPGGGRWIEMVPAAWVASYSRSNVDAAPTVILQPGRQWLLIYCSQETLQYREEAAKTDNGDLYSIELKGFSPADDRAKRSALQSVFVYEKMLVRFCDNAGTIRLAGTPTESISLTYTLSTGAAVADKRGYDLDLRGTLTSPVAYED